jgi:uncharacterized membrane protein
MNPVHVHLMINHLPLYGTLFAALLLAYALLARKEEVRKAGLAILVLLAFASPAVYFSGEKGEDWAERAGLSEERIEAHEEAGKVAFALLLGNGALAAAALLMGAFPASARRRGAVSWIVALASLAVFAWSAWTATTGGRIRHGQEMGVEGSAAGP